MLPTVESKEQISYAGVILWTFPNGGGCLSDVSGATYLFHPWDERRLGAVRERVFPEGFVPEVGSLIQFCIEFGNFGDRATYRVTNVAPLAENEAHPEDVAKLKHIFDDFLWERAAKRGRKHGYIR